MKLGTENKKSVYALIILGVIAAIAVYTQLLSGPSYTPTAAAPPKTADTTDTPAKPDTTPSPDVSRAARPVTARSGASARSSTEFRPVLIPKKPEERIKRIADVDPTLRLDLLEKVMKVPPAGGERDLFQILKAPPVKAADLAKLDEPKVHQFVGPREPPPPPPPPPPPGEKPLEPIPLKYYGFIVERANGKRTAYFKDNDDNILEGTEGSTLDKRYRIVRIGLDKVLMEDTQQKRQQSLNIEPEVTG